MGKTNDENDDMQIFLIDGLMVNEAVTENADGSYTVLINADLCQAKRLLAVDHALNHIKNNDFGKVNVQEIEKNAHIKEG